MSRKTVRWFEVTVTAPSAVSRFRRRTLYKGAVQAPTRRKAESMARRLARHYSGHSTRLPAGTRVDAVEVHVRYS